MCTAWFPFFKKKNQKFSLKKPQTFSFFKGCPLRDWCPFSRLLYLRPYVHQQNHPVLYYPAMVLVRSDVPKISLYTPFTCNVHHTISIFQKINQKFSFKLKIKQKQIQKSLILFCFLKAVHFATGALFHDCSTCDRVFTSKTTLFCIILLWY